MNLTCTYDNPHTLHRECYANGRLLYSYSMDIFFYKSLPPHEIFFGANIGDWKTGQFVGDPMAIPEEYRPIPTDGKMATQ